MADSNSPDWNQLLGAAYGAGVAVVTILGWLGLKGQGPAFFQWWAGFINRKEVAKSELLQEAKTEAKQQATRVEELLEKRIEEMKADHKAQTDALYAKFDECEKRHRESDKATYQQFIDLTKQYSELKGEYKALNEAHRSRIDEDHANTLVAQATAAMIKTNPNVLKNMDATKDNA